MSSNSKVSLYKFYSDSLDRAKKTNERHGQAMFNHLFEIRPDLANEVRGTDKDPFHIIKSSHPNWARFVEFIESRWYL